MKNVTANLILLNLSMAIVMFSPLLPAPWQIVGCGIGIGLTIVFVRRYVQLIKAQQEGRDEDHHESAG
ncbi:hypothetical protein [Lacticaseibacillus paracasei]|uniref:N-acetylmuramoyl-L-alanine amidase n=1 Tax=Lacticaseibacillus paracasei subsp. paracasei Lpp49 TaxID=1256213 RepID=A0ABC9T9K1_LACPA|nr:hypothetical protein [Lacticaseibacillus paracasei]EPC89631.1 hypothetical protein Lpp49_12923 [Lacticaseibacillus paracasei subsp. paracasei Lpp49]